MVLEIEQPRAHHARGVRGEGDQQAYQHGHRRGETELKQEPPAMLDMNETGTK